MRNIVLLTIAIIVGFAISELVVGQIVGYPRYVTGRKDYIIHDSLGPYNKITVWPPYYSTWSVEGGNKVILRNDLGLTGSNVDVSPNDKYVVLLGNSYVEASQYSGDVIAAGQLHQILADRGVGLKVINLGASNHGPYALWYRLLFYEQKYKPEQVILILESFERMKYYYLKWAHTKEYNSTIQVKQLSSKRLTTVQRNVRSSFSYINLIVSAASKVGVRNDIDPRDSISAIPDYAAYEWLLASLMHYKSKYGSGFRFVSLMLDNPFEDELNNYCKKNGINYFVNKMIMLPDNLIGGDGHFNRQGNTELGIYLVSVAIQD